MFNILSCSQIFAQNQRRLRMHSRGSRTFQHSLRAYRIVGIFLRGINFRGFPGQLASTKINLQINVLVWGHVNFLGNWLCCAKIRPGNNFWNTAIKAYAKIYPCKKYPLYGNHTEILIDDKIHKKKQRAAADKAFHVPALSLVCTAHNMCTANFQNDEFT